MRTSIVIAGLVAFLQPEAFAQVTLYPGVLRAITDFEGRAVGPGAGPASLAIAGQPARVTLRWRFQGPAAVTVNGRQLHPVAAADASVSVEFDHRETSRIEWR